VATRERLELRALVERVAWLGTLVMLEQLEVKEVEEVLVQREVLDQSVYQVLSVDKEFKAAWVLLEQPDQLEVTDQKEQLEELDNRAEMEEPGAQVLPVRMEPTERPEQMGTMGALEPLVQLAW